mgnify:CR=1 FL=1
MLFRSFPSEHSINTKNPALWSLVKNTRLHAGYRFHQNLVTKGENQLLQNNGQVDGVFSIFAIDSAMGLAASFGIYPYSSVNYLISTPIEMVYQDLELKGFNIYQGSGGISTAYIGGSTRILDELYFGASIYANFGLINSLTETHLENYYTGKSNRDSKLSGWGLKAGIYYSPIKDLSIGAFFDKQQSMTSECLMTFYNNFIKDTSFSKSESSFSIPDQLGFGVSYLTGKFQFGADIKFQDFSNFTFNAGPNTKFKSSTQYSLGVSRIGNPSYYAPYLDKVTYNFGIGYNDLYYQIAGNNLTEYFASFGMKMPIVGTAFIDAAFVLGTRGTNDPNLVKEYFGRMIIDISIGETWFKPFRREY